MKKIGGFFELELTEGNSIYHDNAIKLTTGRACLNYILKSKKPKKIYIPYYCCDAIIEPIILNNIEYEFYQINEKLEIIEKPKLKSNEFIICCDFFGIKSEYTSDLIETYKDQLIIDNTHSFFIKEYNSLNSSFTSARKYFGVPDGAFLYISNEDKLNVEIKRNQSISVNHNMHSLIGLQEKAYAEYVHYEKQLNSEIENISILSEKLLSTVNYSKIRKKRNENYKFFQNEFSEVNTLMISKNEVDCFCYPLLLKNPINKEILYKEKIFIPNLWLDTTVRNEHLEYEFECKLSKELLPLPIDHRYSIKDLKRVSDIIKKIAYE